jgi:alpha-glucosidase
VYDDDARAKKRNWWKHGVFYQVYPRSFADTNGDGIGDLPGITGKLDYLEWLGIDAIWISPFFRSPMADGGYDVSDHCDVDPLFGTLGDFDQLLEAAHDRGIRILIDYVPNHTSSEHPWFVESRSSRSNPKRDWYWWRDPRSDGSRPNNWISKFDGPAWEWDAATGQFYLHLFLPEQPDLNWSNPEVAEAMRQVLRFWLDRGVDGVRIDVCHGMAKDRELRDNPANPEGERLVSLTGRATFSQLHRYDENRSEVHGIIHDFRRILDSYSQRGRERMAVGEVYLLDPKEVVPYLGDGTDELHLAFNFAFLLSPWSARHLRERVEQSESLLPPTAWPNYSLSNHDHSRHASRYGAERAKAAAMVLLTLRGTPFLYYGEELGMADVPEAGGWDPVGRDPERTPMRWDASLCGGFTSGRPWLPLCHPPVNVASQSEDPDSVLSLYRRLLALRRRTPALHAGDYVTRLAPPDIFAWQRGGEIDVAINMGQEDVRLDLSGIVIAATEPTREGERVAGRTPLAPDEGLVVRLD